jgi:hypothetical protein
VLKLNLAGHTAALHAQYSHGAKFNAGFLGDMQLLPGGNVLVGWGSRPYFSEYTASGKLLLDGVLPGPDLTYRAYKSSWVGTPFFPPSGAARNNHGKSTVYASWDGATRVAGWRVLAGSSARRLASVATKAKSGFETTISLSHTYRSFKVQALDAKRHVLGTSHSFGAPKPGGSPIQSPGFY